MLWKRGKDEFVQSNGGCSSALPARGPSQKRALQALGTGAAFLCHLPGFAAAESTALSALLCPVRF